MILWYSEWINGYDKNLAHVKLLSLTLKRRKFEPFSFFIYWTNNEEQVNIKKVSTIVQISVMYIFIMSCIPLVCCHCAVNIHVMLEETKWIQAKYHQLTWINSLISPISSALENCSSSERTEARANLGGKGNHSKRHSDLSAQFFIKVTNFV